MPLGMSNGFIKNNQITATSQEEDDEYPYHARLNVLGTGWCSQNVETNGPDSEYLQVDFESAVTLTGVATQGSDNSLYTSYVKEYYLEVSMNGNDYSDVIGGDGNRQVCAL